MAIEPKSMSPALMLWEGGKTIISLSMLLTLLHGVRLIGTKEAEFDHLKLVVNERCNTIAEINKALLALSVATAGHNITIGQQDKDMQRIRDDLLRIQAKMDRTPSNVGPIGSAG